MTDKPIWEIIKFPVYLQEINLEEILEYLRNEGFVFHEGKNPYTTGYHQYLSHPNFECKNTVIPKAEWSDCNSRLNDLVQLIREYELKKKTWIET